MHRRWIILLLIIPALILQSCDLGPGSEEIRPDHSFEVSIFDEDGNNLGTITQQSTVPEPGVNSFAMFGNDFIFPGFKESLSETLDLPIDEIFQNEIFLHSASDESNGRNGLTLHFVLYPETSFSPKTYPFIEFPEEYFKASLKRSWEITNNNPEDISYPAPGDSIPDYLTDSDALANLTFRQIGLISELDFGFPVKADRYITMTRTGFIELTASGEDQIEGNFEAEIQAVLGEVLLGDEFPDELDIEVFTIRGTFTAKSGDLDDLFRFIPEYPRFHKGVFVYIVFTQVHYLQQVCT
jgi:hypothetical protein